MEYFGAAGERLQMMFNFDVNQHLFYAMASNDAGPLIEAITATKNRPGTAQWGQFLRNHDELDLGRLKPKQRQTVFDAFGPKKDMQLYNRGIRRRLAPMLQGDRRRLELAYSLMMTLPGTPVIRYGDEIGMGDNLKLPERNCARTPMQWSARAHGGFTTGDRPVMPPIVEGVYGFAHINVEAQRRDPNSLLNWMERVVRMRKELPEIGWGNFSFIATNSPQVLAMRYDHLGKSSVFVHNLGADPLELRLKIPGEHTACPLINLLSANSSNADAKGRHAVTLEPYGYRWYRIDKRGHVPERQHDPAKPEQGGASKLPPEQPPEESPHHVKQVARRRSGGSRRRLAG
jgi:maltose alpha-D-glucosyltransferase/alpha-amylase